MDTSAFVRDGYVAVRGAFDEPVARACREMIWEVLRERGIFPEDRATWAPQGSYLTAPTLRPWPRRSFRAWRLPADSEPAPA